MPALACSRFYCTANFACCPCTSRDLRYFEVLQGELENQEDDDIDPNN